MNLKEEIGHIVFGAMWDAVETVPQDGSEAGPYPGYGEYVEDIITKFREALLSNDVQAPIRQELHDYPRTSTRDTVKTVIEMALDAITGEGDR